MKDLLLRRTCSTIKFPRLTNEIIDFWRCRGRYRRHFLNSLIKQPRRRRQQKPQKFAYLTMKNSIFARAFFIF